MQRGFTLVELAIVLVIIGLIVGGVLTGRDLIKAAEIRAVASDIQKYQTGAAAFRVKYNGVPGDLLSTAAANFGLTVSATNPGTKGEGDGDGVLQNGTEDNVTYSPGGLGGENTLFWRQLGDAQMIPFTSNATGATIDTTGLAGATATTEIALLSPLLPQLRLRPSGFIHLRGGVGINYFMIAQFTVTGSAIGQLLPSASAGFILSPREAQGIDQKLDDGFPATGVVKVYFLGEGHSPVTSSDAYCYDNTTAQGTYATSTEDIANGIRCILRINAGF